MIERNIQINGDYKSCSGCDFLERPDSEVPPRCLRLDKPIYQVEVCKTGQMVSVFALSQRPRGLRRI